MKYIKCLLAMMLLLAATGVMAATVSVNPITVTAGQSSSIVINLTNSETTLTAYQMTLSLPTGVTVKTDEEDECVFTKSSRHKSDHTVTVTKAAEGRYLIVCFSTSKKVISGTSGELLSIEIDTDASLTGTVQGSLTGITFSDTNKQKYTPADVTFNITLATKTAQTLSLTELPEMTEGDAAYTLPQNTDQGLTLTWSVADATIASVSGNSLTPLKAGTTTVTATQAGNDSYLPFTKTFTLTVTAKPAPTDPDTDISLLQNTVYINRVEARAGQTVTLSVKMKNSVVAEGFGFDLVLPEGISVALDEYGDPMAELSTERTSASITNHFDADFKLDGSLNIQAYSSKGRTISGNDGEVALITIKVSESLATGEYPIVLKNIAITDENSTTVTVDRVKSTLEVPAYIIGDANNDGNINVGDLTAISHYILERPDASFLFQAADANQDGNVNVGDLTAVSHLILWGSITRPQAAAARASTNISGMDNVIYIEPCTAEAGSEYTLSVKMKNSVVAEGFGFDLVLPEGITVALDGNGDPKAELSTERTNSSNTNHFDADFKLDGSLNIQAYSSKGRTISGNDGEVALITVQIAGDMELGTYPIQLKNIAISDANSVTYTVDLVETSIEIVSGGSQTILDETSTSVPEATDKAVNIKVLRTIKANEWSTICLPFTMTGDDVAAAFGSDVQLADFTDYDVDDDDDDNVVGITEFTAKAVIEPDEEDAKSEYDNGKTGKKREVYGTFQGTFHAQTEVPENCLFLNSNQFWYSKGNTRMKAFRAYFEFVDVLSSVEGAGSRIGMTFGRSTGISETIRETTGNNRYYDLQGRPVERSTFNVQRSSKAITSNNEEIIYGGIDENGVLDPASRLRIPNIWGDEEEEDF